MTFCIVAVILKFLVRPVQKRAGCRHWRGTRSEGGTLTGWLLIHCCIIPNFFGSPIFSLPSVFIPLSHMIHRRTHTSSARERRTLHKLVKSRRGLSLIARRGTSREELMTEGGLESSAASGWKRYVRDPHWMILLKTKKTREVEDVIPLSRQGGRVYGCGHNSS